MCAAGSDLDWGTGALLGLGDVVFGLGFDYTLSRPHNLTALLLLLLLFYACQLLAGTGSGKQGCWQNHWGGHHASQPD